jgi:hypothetical protein
MDFMKNLMRVCLMLAGSLILGSAYAQKPAVVADNDAGWHRIGETNASFKKQNESIVVLGADEFSAIKIKIKDAPIHIERLQVFYESGEMQDIDVKSEMKAGASSGAFQLDHPDRDINKIAFTYHTVANSQGDKAGVEVYGLKTNQPAGKDSYDDKADKAEKDLEQAKDDTKREAKEAESDLEKAAEKTGDQVSETAAKAAAEVDDKRHDTKVGPQGQVVYISDDNRYYYISEEGKRVFVTEMQLKDKE